MLAILRFNNIKMITLKSGDRAPKFSGVIETGEKISLADYKGKKLILFFYPADGTPTCTAEACNLRDNYQLLREKGFELLGVSPDSEKKHQNFIKKHSLPFPLIADKDLKITHAYGAWGPKQLFGVHYDGVLRSTFVINKKGVIEQVITKVNSKGHAEQILGAI